VTRDLSTDCVGNRLQDQLIATFTVAPAILSHEDREILTSTAAEAESVGELSYSRLKKWRSCPTKLIFLINTTLAQRLRTIWAEISGMAHSRPFLVSKAHVRKLGQK
jgi:hypothetical protein